MPAFAGMTIGRFRGISFKFVAPPHPVIPAKAGIQRLQSHATVQHWMPAFAGMTIGGFRGVSFEFAASVSPLIPAKAGIQRLQSHTTV
jgi:hypothetical protein